MKKQTFEDNMKGWSVISNLLLSILFLIGLSWNKYFKTYIRMAVNRIYLNIFEYFGCLGQKAPWIHCTSLKFKIPKYPTLKYFQTCRFHGIGAIISPVLVCSSFRAFICLLVCSFVCTFVCSFVKGFSKNWHVSFFLNFCMKLGNYKS